MVNVVATPQRRHAAKLVNILKVSFKSFSRRFMLHCASAVLQILIDPNILTLGHFNKVFVSLHFADHVCLMSDNISIVLIHENSYCPQSHLVEILMQ